MPSTFEEDLPHTDFEDVHEYPVATATHKAVDVYNSLLASNLSGGTHMSPNMAVQRANPDDAPDLVIAGRS